MDSLSDMQLRMYWLTHVLQGRAPRSQERAERQGHRLEQGGELAAPGGGHQARAHQDTCEWADWQGEEQQAGRQLSASRQQQER